MGTKLENICEMSKKFPMKTCKLEVKYILLQHLFCDRLYVIQQVVYCVTTKEIKL